MAKQVAGDLMTPIEGRYECVGGIESLVLDDVRYLFGFDLARSYPSAACIAAYTRCQGLAFPRSPGHIS